MCGICVFIVFRATRVCYYDITPSSLEDTEGLLAGLGTLGFVSNNVEFDSLGEGTALTNGDNVSFLDGEGGAAVGSDVLVSLFETTVLSDVVEVVSSYDNSSLHLCGDDLSR